MITQILVIVVAVLIAIIAVIKFVMAVRSGKVTTKDIIDFKEWLVYAVTIAQMEFGKDTAEIKLYSVWDMAIEKFPHITDVITFEQFKEWVDSAKERLIELEENNEAIAELVNGVIDYNLNEEQ